MVACVVGSGPVFRFIIVVPVPDNDQVIALLVFQANGLACCLQWTERPGVAIKPRPKSSPAAMAQSSSPFVHSTTTSLEDAVRTATLADPPFNDPEGDLIIRSSDNVDFIVHKWLLAYASPVFKDMFLLPQQGIVGESDVKDGKPIVATTETADIWRTLLAFIYPSWISAAPELNSLEDALAVLQPSVKYMMEGVEKKIRAALVSPHIVDANPVRVFASACQHRLYAEARIAAKKTLRLPLLGRPYINEFENITAGTLHRLQEYHQECGQAASKIASDLAWLERDSFVWFECAECKGQRNGAWVTLSGNRRIWTVSKWWLEYLVSAGKTLTDKPAGTTVVDPKLVDEAFGKASRCTTCRGRAFGEMREFGEMFAEEVERVTSTVCLFVLHIVVAESLRYPLDKIYLDLPMR